MAALTSCPNDINGNVNVSSSQNPTHFYLRKWAQWNDVVDCTQACQNIPVCTVDGDDFARGKGRPFSAGGSTGNFQDMCHLPGQGTWGSQGWLTSAGGGGTPRYINGTTWSTSVHAPINNVCKCEQGTSGPTRSSMFTHPVLCYNDDLWATPSCPTSIGGKNFVQSWSINHAIFVMTFNKPGVGTWSEPSCESYCNNFTFPQCDLNEYINNPTNTTPADTYRCWMAPPGLEGPTSADVPTDANKCQCAWWNHTALACSFK